jgi:hypothetical protein
MPIQAPVRCTPPRSRWLVGLDLLAIGRNRWFAQPRRSRGNPTFGFPLPRGHPFPLPLFPLSSPAWQIGAVAQPVYATLWQGHLGAA